MSKWVAKLRQVQASKPCRRMPSSEASTDETVAPSGTQLEIPSKADSDGATCSKNSIKTRIPGTLVSFVSGFSRAAEKTESKPNTAGLGVTADTSPKTMSEGEIRLTPDPLVGFVSGCRKVTEKTRDEAEKNVPWREWEERLRAITPKHLPPAPFKLRPHETIIDVELYLRRLHDGLARGPDAPRALTGALQSDIEALEKVIQVQEKSNVT